MDEKKPKKKGRILLFLALIVGIAYLIYSFSYWSGAVTNSATSSEQVGASIASAVVLPHVIAEALAVLFNAIAALFYSRGFALTAAILYTVSLVLFPPYFMFVVIEMILCYVAFALMKKK